MAKAGDGSAPKPHTQTLYCAWTIETAREETAESSCGQAKKDAPPIREWKYKFTTYRTTHSTINQTAPSTTRSPPPSDPSHPAGEWDSIEVSCQGSMVNVIINGREVISCDTSKHPDLKDRLKTGYIGVQNHRSPIDFRNVRIKRLF
ncbi:MAG: DUF1080 domain-containing protein [Candidatus Latescibacteria bacterium]|nr:DUF1080 domain-containing protein [Candidatus Latescibacterota bacterium]